MFSPWERSTPGLLALPSGRLVRGRALRRTHPGAAPVAGEAVDFVRANYAPRAVETPWQCRYVRTFSP